ncbi:MAG: DUF1624 domain-containing protein [Clostridia bacterium]|nr:DUF1624 domain-containing protein [Clostridia bacterium]
MRKSGTQRFWEVDLLRGVAVVMMITFHTLFNLEFFGDYPLVLDGGFWFYFQQATAGLFFLVAGVASTLSYARAGDRSFWRFFRRGGKIFACGMVVTVVTWLFLREGYVVFGVLHCIGLSIILAYPFLPRPYWALPAGILCIAVGNYLDNRTFSFPYLLWLGFIPERFYTVDYFPLLPWFGLFLLGLFLGGLLYPSGQRRFSLPDCPEFPPLHGVIFLGRHSLVIYLLHQPVLLALLAVLGVIDLGF